MNAPVQRIRDLERVLADRFTEEVPTRYFFVADRFQAAAGYGGKSAAAILDDVEHVDRAIAHYDVLRRQQRLDLVDVAIIISQTWHTDHAQDSAAIAGSLVEANWNWDKDRFGEDRAWRQQRSSGQFEGQIAARLARPMTT